MNLHRPHLGDEARKLAYFGYYKYLFGRDLPLAAELASTVRGWERAAKARDSPVSKDVWEEQYRSGKWDYMKEVGQLARYSVIVGYLEFFAKGGMILDVGSGEGILEEHLSAGRFGGCLGVDLSEEAIARAEARTVDRAAEHISFVCADVERYVPKGPYDAVVFNEILYYLDDPLASSARYVDCLAPDGVFIVSLYGVSARANAIRRRLDETYRVVDQVRTSNGPNAWVCSVYQPR